MLLHLSFNSEFNFFSPLRKGSLFSLCTDDKVHRYVLWTYLVNKTRIVDESSSSLNVGICFWYTLQLSDYKEKQCSSPFAVPSVCFPDGKYPNYPKGGQFLNKMIFPSWKGLILFEGLLSFQCPSSVFLPYKYIICQNIQPAELQERLSGVITLGKYNSLFQLLNNYTLLSCPCSDCSPLVLWG